MKERLDEILYIQYSKDDQYLAVATSAGKVRIYDTTSGKLHSNLSASYSLKPITALRWQEIKNNQEVSQILISGSVDGSINYWNINAEEPFFTLKDRNLTEVYSIDISKSEAQLAVGCKDFSVKVYDNNKKTLKAALHPGDSTTFGHSNRVHSVKFTENPNIILSGGSDRTAFIWDLRIARSVGYLYGPYICGDAIDVMKDTMLIGSFDKENPLQLWSISKKELLENITWNAEAKDGSSGYVNVAKFEKKLHNEYIIASGRTGANKNEVRLFNNKGKRELIGKIELDKVATSVDFANTKQKFAIGVVDGFVYTFNY